MPWPFSLRHSVVVEHPSEDGVLFADRFAFRLYRELVHPDALDNVFFSPCSVTFCLAMMYEGAIGETRQAIATTLEISDLHEKARSIAVVQLQKALHVTDSGVQLMIANSLWCNRQIAIRSDYLSRMGADFGATVESTDFSDKNTVQRINKWVREKTHNKIDGIINEISPLALLVALNAIYFKGAWANPFDLSLTNDRWFAPAEGPKKQVPMMSQYGRFRYLERRKFQAVVLPYNERRTSMYVFLPAPRQTLADFERLLTSGEWQEWMSGFEEVKGVVRLPRFNVSFSAYLNGALTNMGMGIAFDQKRARFDHICPPPPESWIDLVLHRAVAEVNEEGTEAAAVTMVGVTLACAMRPRPERTFEMNVDRPFFFAIRDEQTGALLFLGRVTDPTR